MRLQYVFKIVVSENGITKISILTNKQQLIGFQEVKEVRLNRFAGARTPRGYITDGYYESNVILNNDEHILISPDHFENYTEIVKSLTENLTKFSSEKMASHNSSL